MAIIMDKSVFFKNCFLIALLLLNSLFLRGESHYKRSFNGFVLATWNIGHFSNGSKSYSTIKENDMDSVCEAYKGLIYQSIGADVMCINEYSQSLGKDLDGKTRRADRCIFGKFKNKVICEQYGYSCNAIFGNIRFRNWSKNDFESSKPYINKDYRAAHYYYISTDIHVGGKIIKFICAHLISRQDKLCQEEISELINKYKDCDRVIMCGDWNTTDFSQFRKAGYSLANNGTLFTYPYKSYPLDNIIVKGLRISDVKMIKTDLSDHYPLVCTVSVK